MTHHIYRTQAPLDHVPEHRPPWKLTNFIPWVVAFAAFLFILQIIFN